MAAIEYRRDHAHSASKGVSRWAHRIAKRLAALVLVVLFDPAVVVAVLFLTGIVRYRAAASSVRRIGGGERAMSRASRHFAEMSLTGVADCGPCLSGIDPCATKV